MPSHPIFRTPLTVNPKFELAPVPREYNYWPETAAWTSLPIWRIRKLDRRQVGYGLVANSDGFDDSPDAEIISRGVNSKGPASVALARQGNFFLWGFPATPGDMTESARRCFINAVCYIKHFDGQKPLVHKDRGATGRAGLLEGIAMQRKIMRDGDYKEGLKPAERNDPEQVAGMRKMYVEMFQGSFPAELVKEFGEDYDKYQSWVRENYDLLHLVPAASKDAWPPNHFAVDDDLKVLGLKSNHDVATLEGCVKLLEKGDRAEAARRVLKRYTFVDFLDAQGWRQWLDANKKRLFFSEMGGFKFVATPTNFVPRYDAPRPLLNKDAPLDHNRPVVATVAVEPTQVLSGSTCKIKVKVVVAPMWHIAAGGGPALPMTIAVELPKDVEAVGEWSGPRPEAASNGELHYTGMLEFTRTLRVRTGAEESASKVVCRVNYTVCDRNSCRPPATETVEAYIVVANAPAEPKSAETLPTKAAEASKAK